MNNKPQRTCPKHQPTGLTPTNHSCHSHVSSTQQLFHNLHCRQLGCEFALSGIDSYENVDAEGARNLFELFLEKFDPVTDFLYRR